MRVIVVGAGVVGLSCAIRLAEAGHRVDVLARDLPLETTSAIAAALWEPYLAAPPERVGPWAEDTRTEFVRLAGLEGWGVRMRTGHQLTDAGTRAMYAPVADMPVYLRRLTARLAELDGTLTRLNLPALPPGADLVVNCSGLGARLLGEDPTVTPVRGQVIVTEQFGLTEFWLDTRAGASPTYVIPREHSVVVGGTSTPGDWSRTPDPASTADILARATALVPEVAGARIRQVRVGLRPARPEVRLERSGHVLHCYGHGGSGMTLSWGCADEVARIVGSG